MQEPTREVSLITQTGMIPGEQSIEGIVRPLPSLAYSVLRGYQADLSPETIRRHQCDLQVFCAFLRASQGLVAEAEKLASDLYAWRAVAVDAHLLREYLLWYLDQPGTLSNINVKFSTVKVYCKLLYQAEIISMETYAQIETVKSLHRGKFHTIDKNRAARGVATRTPYSKKSEPVFVTREQVSLLLRKIGGADARACSDNLLVRLSWFHALRVSEVCALTLENFDLEHNLLMFDRPKTHLYGQIIKLNERTIEKVVQVMDTRVKETTLTEHIPLFASFKPRHRGETPQERPIMPKIASARIALLFERHLGIKGVSMHDGRHHFAEQVFSDPTNSLADIMDAAGWKTPAIALGYRQKRKIVNAGIKDLEGE